jgi:hypothetical protein
MVMKCFRYIDTSVVANGWLPPMPLEGLLYVLALQSYYSGHCYMQNFLASDTSRLYVSRYPAYH